MFLGGLAGAMLSVLLKFYGRSVRMVPAREYPFTLKLAIALLFAMFCLFLAFWVAAVSFHGGPIWARLGLGYGVAAMVALWVSYRRTAGTALFVLAAISIAGAIVPVVGAIFMYQDWQVKRSRAEDNRIEISDLRAEMLRSGAGNPIGIRLRFEARFPKDREYWLVPSVKADEPRDFEFRTMTAREEASPRVIKWFAPEHFEARKAYRLVYEFVPFFVTWEPWNGGEYREGATLCLKRLGPAEREYLTRMLQTDAPSLVVDFGRTPTRRVALDSAYSMKELYEGYLREKTVRCWVTPRPD